MRHTRGAHHSRSLCLCRIGHSYVNPEIHPSSTNDDGKPRSYLKWVDTLGAYEVNEFASFIQINHTKTGAEPEPTIEVRADTSWSYATDRDHTTFTFRQPGESAATINVPGNMASPLLAWLKRLN